MVLTPILCFSQAQNNSIFSRYGIGDLYTPNYSFLTGMGNASIGYFNNVQANPSNPASYSFLTKTSFDIGISAKYYVAETGGLDFKNWTGGFDYMSLAFPLFNSINKALNPIKRDYNLGMAIGMRQYSKVGYNITSTETIGEAGLLERNYTGFGGTTKAHIGLSGNYKNLSAGFNLGYIFGKISYEKNINFPDIQNVFNTAFGSFYNMNGFVFDGGLMYSHELNKAERKVNPNIPSDNFNFGLTYSSNANLNTTASITELNFYVPTIANASVITDTLTNITDQEGKLKIPGRIGFGTSYVKGNKWGASVSYEQSPWSIYSNDANQENLADTYSINMGAFYIPNYKSITNFLSRVSYKVGFFMKTEPASFGGEQVDNIGITAGLGAPFLYQRKTSIADLNIVLGRKKGGSVIVENYMELRFGFSFNDDEWFLKRKYN